MSCRDLFLCFDDYINYFSHYVMLDYTEPCIVVGLFDHLGTSGLMNDCRNPFPGARTVHLNKSGWQLQWDYQQVEKPPSGKGSCVMRASVGLASLGSHSKANHLCGSITVLALIA
jgi:hypothetical protein